MDITIRREPPTVPVYALTEGAVFQYRAGIFRVYRMDPLVDRQWASEQGTPFVYVNIDTGQVHPVFLEEYIVPMVVTEITTILTDKRCLISAIEPGQTFTTAGIPGIVWIKTSQNRISAVNAHGGSMAYFPGWGWARSLDNPAPHHQFLSPHDHPDDLVYLSRYTLGIFGCVDRYTPYSKYL